MFSVAIDGPAGAGKSTVAKLVSKKLEFIYVDTGALYRATALFFISNNKSIKDISSIEENLKLINIKIKFIDNEQHILLNEEDVSSRIRTPEISMAASDISAVKPVREFLLSTQKNIADKNNVVMDGRDIATVVLPNANVKIFLTASYEERAKRRYNELISKGINVGFNDVIEDIKQRDYNDSHREIAPLKPAKESIIVDSTDMSVDTTVNNILSIIEENIN